MSWIKDLNKELEERREYNKTTDAKKEAYDRQKKWIAAQGGKSVKNENRGIFKRDKKQRIEDARKGGTISAKKYKGKFIKEWTEKNADKVFEQSSRIGKKQGKANVESGHLDRLHEQYSKENAKYFDHNEKVCPNCNKTIKGLGMYSRWHGDNCSELKKIQEQLKVISHLPNRFSSNDVVKICKKLGFNRKYIKYGICKNPNYIKVIYEGTNQNNPSIFEKINLDN